MEKEKLSRSLGLFDLVMFNVVAIVGLRWTAKAAHIGPSAILLWLGAMAFFFIPSALTVAELSRKIPAEGGIYVWTKEALGEFHGFICGFFYWVNNLIYFPNLLMFVAGVALYIFGPSLVKGYQDNSIYTAAVTLSVLALVVIMNIFGMKTAKWLQNLGSLGSWVPAGVLIVMGVIAYVKFGPANTFTAATLKPKFDLGILSLFSTLCFAFAGMELQSCLSGEVKNPEKNIPKAILLSGAAIALIYILCTSSLLVALPADKINIISGVPQVVMDVAGKINLLWLAPIVALFMTLGGLGGCGAWLAGTARIPYVIGIDKYLPEWLGHIHPKYKTPVNALVLMGVVSALFSLMAAIGSSVRETYDVLVDATTVLYLIPYLYLFISFIILKNKKPGGNKSIGPDDDITDGAQKEPGESTTAKDLNFPVGLGYVGAVTTLTAIILALYPPSDTPNILVYELKVGGGVLIFAVIALVLFALGSRKK